MKLEKKKVGNPFMESVNSMVKKVDDLMREFKIRQIQDPQYIILDNADFIQMFKISGRTGQMWREEGLIEYSQEKGKIYYKLSGIKTFLEKYRRK